MQIRFSGDPAELLFDFNMTYKGYYPFCRFTAVAAGDDLVYAAGTDQSGTPHLFSSTNGSVWAPVNIAAKLMLISVKDYGDIIRILYNRENHQPMLITRNGYLVILPDCPRCVSARQVSNCQLADAEFEDGKVKLTDETGAVSYAMYRRSQQYLCDWSFAEPWLRKGGLLLDLRDPGKAKAAPLPYANVIAPKILEYLLGKIPRDTAVFFVCEYGFQAEEAVSEARRMGYERAYTLGGIEDIRGGNGGILPKMNAQAPG